MKELLRLEEMGQLALGIFLFNQLDYAWWYFLVFILVPDLSMIGYVVNHKIGAWTYNFFHHKALGVLVLIIGFLFHINWICLAGVILFSHAVMDRIFGYGLKYESGFKYTHLGVIGK